MAIQNKKRAASLPKAVREKLALCHDRPSQVIFLDIETTGLSHYYDEITIVGWTLGGRSGTFIKGDNPTPMLNAIGSAVALVTFNGIRFDAKFLVQEFPKIELPATHVDLMYLCRRVGLQGGQKAIEQELGIDFRQDIQGVDGFAAVLLWHQYLRGELDALRTLITYNRADIAAMGALFDHALRRLGFEADLLSDPIEFVEWSAPPDRHSLPTIKKAPHSESARMPTFRELFSGSKAESAKIVGIDLTGSEKRPSGWCNLTGHHAETKTLSSDEAIIAETIAADPEFVSIDSPLCLPTGRVSVFDDDPGRDEYGIMRICERELKRRGVNVYPCLLPSMQKLTARGIKLADEFRKMGLPVIESYPGAAQDIMRIPRKGAGVEWLKLGLSEFGISGRYVDQHVTHDELDAITSALVGTFHLAGLSEGLGTETEPPLIIPRLQREDRPLVIGVSGPIAAGKTTLAKGLEDLGFAYTRFSLVIDNLLRERDLPVDRKHRQEMGAEINRTGRQRQLAEMTIARVSTAKRIVVDGLRFPEDHAFLKEYFGYRFFHIFVDADEGNRRSRYFLRDEGRANVGRSAFDDASASEVEQKVSKMRPLADHTVFNNGLERDMLTDVNRLLSAFEAET
ncbi:ribonuclease H-like domain-containing protein [Parasphingopyxis lamellibrachiae]|uniref:AAA domain-containing protein n=1 Tax=Parasphingopyxis lamellibrachiae TaxID=680125 RepID=A0A3D9FJE2_9SPHN|nr:ribonuclease H-like domain-containing protein [Parasphingopyxis lamellibrachiae]RED17722.1 AAA domain-containing protein [Parasphingopyxis lamellibrachiae]